MRLVAKIALPFFLLLFSAGAAGQDTQTQKLLSGYAGAEPLRSGIVGVLAVRGADTLAQMNRRVKMVPASNVKLITTGLSLLSLGADWRFKTTLSYTGSISDGVLDGDLYIVGGGDPTIAAQTSCADSLEVTFRAWKAVLERSGIRAIKGRIVGDSRFFNRPLVDSSWQAEDLGSIDGAGPQGLNFFGNSVVFNVSGGEVGKAPQIETLYPDTPWMSYVNSAVTTEVKSDNSLYYVCSDLAPCGEFHGKFPSGRKDYKLYCSNPFPAYTCAYFFCNYLISNGIAVEGGYADISPQGNVRSDLLFSDIGHAAAVSGDLESLGTKDSPDLWGIVRDTNFDSNNFYAETLFNMLAVKQYGVSDRALSVQAATEMLSSLGLRPYGACVIRDGSGLSRKNYVSPEFFVRFLRRMYSGPVRDYYVASLPNPGKGTLKNRLAGASLEVRRRIFMKSGSMNGVLCYSGYILSPDSDRSKTIFFSILTNNVSAPSWKVAPIIDEILLSLASEP